MTYSLKKKILTRTKVNKEAFMKKIIQNIFSVRSSLDGTHNVLSILGLKLKFKRKNKSKRLTNSDDNSRSFSDPVPVSGAEYRFIELNKQYFKVKNHWCWDEYDRQILETKNYIYNSYKYFLTPKSTYVDIGAWVGKTIFFAAELGGKRIFAVEANPLNFELIRENCSMNKLTENVYVDNLCITDKDNETIGFDGFNNEVNTSFISCIGGDKWQIPSKKLITYLTENNLIENEDLFIKIDIEGAEELILEDLEKLSQKDTVSILLSLYPTFMKNKYETCEKLLEICSKFKYVLDNTMQLLTKEKLKQMVIDEAYPVRGTKHGNFFEIVLSNKSVDYKKYWTEDNCKNIIPLIGNEFPEGWSPIELIKDIVKDYPYESILDFGCGYGRLSKSFDKEKYLGIDLNPNAIKIAKENNPDYNYQEFCVDSISFPEADLCMAYTVFLHLDDVTLKDTLKKLTKTIKKNFIISEILGREWRRDGFPLVFNREKDEYIGIMKKFGFEFDKEIRRPYKRYAESAYYSDKNTDISFLIFRKSEIEE